MFKRPLAPRLAPISLAALALASCTTSSGGQTASTTATPDQCASFDASTLAANAAKRWVPAAEALPAFCEVSGTLTPVAGSTIGVVYRLPAQWNGKVLGIGGGGWAGNVTLAAASEGLAQGYATMQTDGGNAGTDVWANSWVAERPESAIDFSHRAIHLMTERGKAVAAAFYGRAHDRAYYNGCSTGGRMGLMEAQRYPSDYDAIIAGAPVYTLQTQTSAVFRNQLFAANNAAGAFTAEDLQLVQSSVLAQCDARDGLADGIVNDPASCNWQPSSLQCTGGKTASCLTAGQVTALQGAYDGRRASDGSWAMLPMRRGGEASWAFFVGTNGTGADPSRGGGLGGVYPIANPGVEWNMLGMTETDYLTVRRSPFAALYEAKNPDLSAFFARGGKLMLWHGESDPGPSPVATLDYVQAVQRQNPAAANQLSYYTLPGVGHCRGGPGADAVDYLSAMDEWVTTGRAPATLVGHNRQSNITRPHCAWPGVARFNGNGDANDPANWTCTARGA
jgi:feruloyl esterase